MSWSIPTIESAPAAEAKQAIADNPNLPRPVKDYVIAGIEGLAAYFGDEKVAVAVSGYGHVCNGPGSYNVTTATIEVKPA